MGDIDATAVAAPLTAPLRSADYRKLWIAQTISVIGDKLNQIALAILVYERTGSMLQIGAMLAVSALPAALFSLPAGALVDRWDRRTTMLSADLCRALTVALVPLTAIRGLAAVYALAFVAALFSLLFEPARLAIVPDLVSEDELAAANSLDHASMAGSELLGLAVGGIAVAAIGWQFAFWADAATFLVSAAFVFSVSYRSIRTGRAPGSGAGLLTTLNAEIVEGVRAIWRSPVMRDLAGVYVVLAFAGSALLTLGHLYALYTFAGGSVGLALIDGAATVGVLVGSVLVGRRGMRSLGMTFLLGTLGFGVSTTLLAASPSLLWSLPFMFAAGIADMFFLVPMVTLLQEHAGPVMRGRVLSARTAIGRVSGAVGLLGAGAFAEHLGVRPVTVAMGSLIVVLALVGLTRPALRTA